MNMQFLSILSSSSKMEAENSSVWQEAPAMLAGPGEPHQKHAQNHFRLMDLQPKPRFYKKIKSLSQFYDHSVEKDWLQHLSWSFQLLEYQMCWKGGGFIWYELTSPLAHMFFAVVTAMVMMISWNYDSAG